MRIALIADPGSPHTRVWVEACAVRGHEVLLFSAYKQAPPADLPARITAPLAPGEARGVPLSPPRQASAEGGQGRAPGGPSDPWKLRTITRAARLAPACRRWIAATRPDRLVALRFQPEGYLAAWSGMRPYALVSWGQDVLRFASGHALHRALSRVAARRASLLIGETGPVVEALSRLAGETRPVARGRGDMRRGPRIEQGWTGIDIAFWRPARAGERHAARSELAEVHPDWRGWLARSAAGSPIVLSPRSVDRHGHQRELIEAFARLEEPPLLLQLGSGDAAERAYCADLVRRLGLAGRVCDLGKVGAEDLRRLFWLSAVAASLWSPDGLSQTLLQAMACGVMPLCADLSGNAAWLDGERAGLLVDPADVGAIAERLRLALGSPALREEAATRGRALVAERADRAVRMERLVDLVLAM